VNTGIGGPLQIDEVDLRWVPAKGNRESRHYRSHDNEDRTWMAYVLVRHHVSIPPVGAPGGTPITKRRQRLDSGFRQNDIISFDGKWRISEADEPKMSSNYILNRMVIQATAQ